ncbi:outer membrane beta-barrel protein [Marinigracilibium pacificum]|uniref:Porin family protein n=1 Tax=Marinigracilibium pacificum TaxID=2729599 RepID=A0A848J1H8_9BACT|nr:outer membrane beta-barrel protein [Marinigracilibium pacificum]NMM49541.1 porin family protein [Marinigracilibium pacificum]
MREFLLSLVALVFINVAASAQEFKPFSVGVDLGANLSFDNDFGSRFGFLFGIEPAYKITDQIEASIKYDGIVLIGFDDELYTQGARMGSWSLNGKYFFNTNTFRPFAGFGAGVYNITEFTENNDLGFDSYYLGKHFGFAPRGGFQVKHFRFTAEYNIILGEESRNQDYFAIRAGVVIGGGRN